MKKIFIIFVTFSLFIFLNVNAKVWRINNTTGISRNFATPAEANASASVVNGDTLHIEPSTVSYGDLSLTKKLVLIGPGYFLNENPETQACSPTVATLNVINFNNGSAYSKIMGITTTGTLNVNTNFITITRNNIKSQINISNLVTDINIDRNYISFNTNGNTLYCGGNVNRITITNNFIQNTNATTSTTYYAINLGTGFNGIMKNNIIYGNMVVYNTTLTNNIMVLGNFFPNNSIYTNNISVGTQFGVNNNNQSNKSLASLFVGATNNSTDGQWQLKSDSPAKGAGTEGEDCGIFGGCNPYILSGIPGIPAIYYIKPLRINNTTHTLYIDTLKVKSRY